ncbi:MAG: Hpt domain-containing protein [Pseudomonadota bacterium]
MTDTLGPAYDRDRLGELFGDDPATLAEVERDFLDTARAAEREIGGTEDLVAIARAAHRLKGASGMIGAEPLRRLAEAVEQAARTGSLAGVRRLWIQFEPEIRRVAERAGIELAEAEGPGPRADRRRR